MDGVHVFFFRGLSTYGHDRAKWSFLDFGPVYQNLLAAFERRGVDFHAVLGMGSGNFVDLADRAYTFITAHPAWLDPSLPVHFLGHSAGGIVARLVKQRLEDEALRRGIDLAAKLPSCLTFASPHLGAGLAEMCLTMPERYRGSTRVMRALGFNIRSKTDFFRELTPARVKSFFPPSSAKSSVAEASIVCWAGREEWCRPLKLFYKLKAFNDFDVVSDGVVERDSQPFGEVIAELKIDHFRQVGFFGETHRFDQLCDEAARFFKKQNARVT